jgi:hypothetical protein
VDREGILALDAVVPGMGRGYRELQKADHVHQMTVGSWSNAVVRGKPCRLLLVEDTVVYVEKAGAAVESHR